MASPSDGPSLIQALAARLAVPFLILGFMAVFAWESRDLQFIAAGYPRFLMAILVPVMLIVILREVLAAFRSKRDRDAAPAMAAESSDGAAVWRDWIPSAALSLWLIGFAAVLPQVGTLPAVAVFIPGVLITLGYRSWVGIISITGGTLLTIYLLFIRLFQIPLPGVW
ncbi:tripartite tricarboxylate transporter TctB family protein [Fodinicurvata sp. EGI_FJ10296]|uniref:tripartite tricarboxylate transporter TctB family protein n=1 Tax=Fodinicurvata sp. EGI_FJ10296 TaxID=3231908 RepID=UPI0034528182